MKYLVIIIGEFVGKLYKFRLHLNVIFINGIHLRCILSVLLSFYWKKTFNLGFTLNEIFHYNDRYICW